MEYKRFLIFSGLHKPNEAIPLISPIGRAQALIREMTIILVCRWDFPPIGMATAATRSFCHSHGRVTKPSSRNAASMMLTLNIQRLPEAGIKRGAKPIKLGAIMLLVLIFLWPF